MQPASCGTSDGSLTLSVSGNGPYSYSIDNGQTWQAGLIAAGLAPGNVEMLVRDAINCVSSAYNTTITSNNVGFTYSVATTPVTCQSQGTLTISFDSGTPPYRISVDGAAFTSILTVGDLGSGGHSLLIGDASGCLVSGQFTIADHSITGNFITSVSAADCDSSDGSIEILVPPSNGVAPFSYSIDNLNFFQTNIFDSLPAGSYTLIVKDQLNCSVSANYSVGTNSVENLNYYNVNFPTCDQPNGSIYAYTSNSGLMKDFGS
jgi:hypothetical protein